MTANEAIDKLLREQNAEVRAIVEKFRKLTAGKRRNYGTAALYLLTVLERAIAKERVKRRASR